MAHRRMPRITLEEWRHIGFACQQLAAVHSTLSRTSWAGAPSCMASIGQVHELLARLYNKGETAAVTYPSNAAQRPAEPTGEPGGGDSHG